MREGEVVLRFSRSDENEGAENSVTFGYYSEQGRHRTRRAAIAMRDGLRAEGYEASAFDVPRNGSEIP